MPNVIITKVMMLAMVGAMLTSACSTLLKTPESKAEMDPKLAIEAYARVLNGFVNKEGEIDFEGLQKNRQDLSMYIHYVAKKRFHEIGNPNQVLAHHLNAYNALSMFTVLEKNIPKTNSGLNKLFFFRLTKMEIGGQVMSLETYEKDFIRSLNEDRVHWALNCMSVSCPRLPQEIFKAETVQTQLQDLSIEFFNSEKHVQVNNDKKEVAVTEIIKFFPEDFVPVKASSVVNYVNLYRKNPVPQDYKVRYISYDWTINNSRRSR